MSDTELKPCPFCGSTSVKVNHRDIGFLGQNSHGVKKIKYQSYAKCNKCHARSKPITFAYMEDTTQGREDTQKADKEAIEAWNRRENSHE